MSDLLQLEPEPEKAAYSSLFAKGFRPFFLVAAVHAAFMVPIWAFVRSGTATPSAYLGPLRWHTHEMIFGFTLAVIAGFLLTAVSNWTKRVTAISGKLAALVGLWIIGRLLLSFRVAPDIVTAVVDLAFLPALGWAIGKPIVQSRNKRNYLFLAIVAVLFAANLAMHLELLGVVRGGYAWGQTLSLDLIAIVLLVVTGRIVPAFTRSALKREASTDEETAEAESITAIAPLERASLWSMGLLVLWDMAAFTVPGRGYLCLLLAVLTLARMARYGSGKTLNNSLLWVLHLGTLWIPIWLALRGISATTGWLSAALATHALTVGAIGTLTLGMMPRVTLGHTGRPLKTSPPLTLAFVLITLAALLRISGLSLFGAAHYTSVVHGSGTLFSLAFMLYIIPLGSFLLKPRVDGKAG